MIYNFEFQTHRSPPCIFILHRSGFRLPLDEIKLAWREVATKVDFALLQQSLNYQALISMIEVTSALFVLPCFNTDPKSKSVIFSKLYILKNLNLK